MTAFSPDPAPNRIHTVHRAGAGLLGGFLIVFGLAGLTRAQGFVTAQGAVVFGLSTNGLLATRFTGHLPATSPYAHGDLERVGGRTDRGDGTADRALAEAERAVAQHAATSDQISGVAAASTRRSHDERRRAFVSAHAGGRPS